MSDFKTLNDLGGNMYLEEHGVTIKDILTKEKLKQSAIKDIKELIRAKEFLEIFGCDVEPVIEYIKWKFNVEEEDLK